MLMRHRRSKVRERNTLTVRAKPGNRCQGLVNCGFLSFPCALGRSGIVVNKTEGDGGTPAGSWRLLQVLYRADRVSRPITSLPILPISISDGWCDAPGDRNYNSPVQLPYPVSSENMWREDSIYNIVVVLNHNTQPRMRGRGSAVFLHLAREGFTPTQGCVAFFERDLRRLLKFTGPGSSIVIAP
jgi:L,D-peptidoglycan transpeptidase YkuD (ErfK/YbiS/YcfS/YnhG family)